MNTKVRFEDIEDIINETLLEGKSFKIKPNGVSMLPIIRPGEDSVFIKKPQGRLKKYDIAFYKRDSGQFVLHRVIGVTNDSYIMCGDNQWAKEYNIYDKNIIGVVEKIERDGEIFTCNNKRYMRYVKNRVNTRIIRKCRSILAYKIKSIIKRLYK